MMLKLMINLVVLVTFVGFVVTQMLIPAIKGSRLFPLFRSERAKLEGEIADAREEADVESLRKMTPKKRGTASKKES